MYQCIPTHPQARAPWIEQDMSVRLKPGGKAAALELSDRQ